MAGPAAPGNSHFPTDKEAGTCIGSDPGVIPKTPETMNTKERTEAVNLLVEREEQRIAQEQREKRRERRQRREEMERGVVQLSQAVVVIKWCIATITAIMVAGAVAIVALAVEVEREVEEIKREAEEISYKIRHPLETLGGMAGRKAEEAIKEAFEEN